MKNPLLILFCCFILQSAANQSAVISAGMKHQREWKNFEKNMGSNLMNRHTRHPAFKNIFLKMPLKTKGDFRIDGYSFVGLGAFHASQKDRIRAPSLRLLNHRFYNSPKEEKKFWDYGMK